MRLSHCLFFALCLLPAGWLFAAAPADSQIKSALQDLERYEQQFPASATVNPSSARRTLKLLGLTRQRLDSSSNQQHASWQEADARLKALIARLDAAVNPSSSPPPSAPQPTASQPAATQTTQSIPAAPQMISQYRVRIQKILRDIKSATDTMDQSGVKPFQDPEYVAKLEQAAGRFQASLAKYQNFANDPDVVAASSAFSQFQNMIAFGKQHAAQTLQELGDVQQRLAVLNQQIRQLEKPETPQQPFQEGQLATWLQQLARTRQSAVALSQPLPEIKQKAYLPNNRFTVEQGSPYDFNDVDRLERSLVEFVRDIDTELEQFGIGLQNAVGHIEEGLRFFESFDPLDPNHQIKHFLGEGEADELRQRLAQFRRDAQEIAEYAKLINDPAYPQRLELVALGQATEERFESDFRKALAAVRMPKPASKDSKLIDIARQTLANYDYIGTIERLIINADKVRSSKETSEAQYDKIDVSLSGDITLTGTKTTYFYEWDQFQVATAEPVGDRYFIFYNTLKYYVSGASSTPLDKWILSARIQGSQIPKENIRKD